MKQDHNGHLLNETEVFMPLILDIMTLRMNMFTSIMIAISITTIICTHAFSFLSHHWIYRSCRLSSSSFPSTFNNILRFNRNHRMAMNTDLEEDSSGKRQKSSTTFDRMKNMEFRLTQLEQQAPDTLFGFYEPIFKSFSVRPGKAKRFSVTTTLFSLLAIQSASDPNIYSSKIQLNMKAPFLLSGDVKLLDIVNATLYADWREDDLLQVPLIIHTILTIDKDRILLDPKVMDEVLTERMKQLISALFSARPLRRNGQYQPLSDYIIFQCAQALTTLYKATPQVLVSEDQKNTSVQEYRFGGMKDNYLSMGRLPINALPDGAASQLSVALSRCAEVSFNELCRQLAFRAAGDRTNFDPIRYVSGINPYCYPHYI